MDSLTINEAAQTSGWSPRMLRYIERAGLLAPRRSSGGYRLYGAAELQRLRTLRQLLERFEIGLADMGFAMRLRQESQLRDSVAGWFEAEAERPANVDPEDWLRWEQDKHQALISTQTQRMENV